MVDDSRKIIRVSAESDKAIRDYGERRSIDFGAAADALIATAVSRLNALKRYAKNREPQAPGKKKAVKKTAAKKKTGAKRKMPSAAEMVAKKKATTAKARPPVTAPSAAEMNGALAPMDA